MAPSVPFVAHERSARRACIACARAPTRGHPPAFGAAARDSSRECHRPLTPAPPRRAAPVQVLELSFDAVHNKPEGALLQLLLAYGASQLPLAARLVRVRGISPRVVAQASPRYSTVGSR